VKDATAYWTASGMPDVRLTKFLAVCEVSRTVVAVARAPDADHFVMLVPFDRLIRTSATGRLLPWTLDQVAEEAVVHLDHHRHLVAG